MNWFKENPFAAGLTAATAVLALAAIYFAYAQNASFAEQTDAFSTNTTTFGRLHSAKPFPNEENLKAAEAESKRAAKILHDLAAEVGRQSAAVDLNLTPRDFQDKLSSAVAAAEAAAASTEVVLPEDFYLGFADYKAQPPSELAAPMLGQQLDTIANVTGLLLKSGIKQLVGIQRAPLPAESESSGEKNQSDESLAATVRLAPFNVEFVADPMAFRSALSAIVTAQPLVLVRLVSVTNSSPTPPPKESTAALIEGTEQPAASGETNTGIPVVFGKETLNAKLRLSSVSVAAPSTKE